MTLSQDIDFDKLAKITGGSSGSELKAIATEAGMFAIRNDKDNVEYEDLQSAVAKVLMHKDKSVNLSETMFV